MIDAAVSYDNRNGVWMNVAICNNKGSSIEILRRFESFGQLLNDRFYVDSFESGSEMISNIKSGESYDLIIIYCDSDNKGYECGPYLREEMSNNDVELVYVLSSEYVPIRLANSKPLILLKDPLNSNDIEYIIKLYYKAKRETRLSYVCKNRHGTTLIPYKDIMYIYSNVRLLTVVTKECSHTCYDRIKNFPEIPGLYQINQSFIINANYIAVYSKAKVVMVDGIEILISRNFKDDVREKLERYVKENAVPISE